MIPASAASHVPPSSVLKAIRDGGDIGNLIGFRLERDDNRTPVSWRIYGDNGIVTVDITTHLCVRATAMYALPIGWDLPDAHVSLDAYPTSV